MYLNGKKQWAIWENIWNKNSLSNGKTKQQLEGCSRDIGFTFPNKENSNFPFSGDERTVMQQVWVRERMIVKVEIAHD
jgi:hypothetical protein